MSVCVYYPWHPLHGQVLDVCGAHRAVGERCYVVMLADGTKADLPVWMTEAEARCDVALVEIPRVSVAALEAVRRLLDAARRSGEADDRP